MPPSNRRLPGNVRLFMGLLLVVAFLPFLGSARYSSTSSSPVPDPNSPFGVAGVMRWPDWGSFDRPASAMVDTGGSWVREDFVWGLIEPHDTVFEWTATDRIVDALAAKNLNVLGIISYSTSWASPSKDDDKGTSITSFYPPDNNKYYAFVRTLVDRYKSKVHYWEIWNEPNSDLFWKPAPNARQYADLLKTAYKAVKDSDPKAKVLSGGLSGNAVPFLEEMVDAGAGNSFDILAIHPYAVPVDNSQGRLESRPDVHKLVEVELAKYHAFLQRHGYNRPIWITEIGWPAGDWGLDAQGQADYLAQAYAQLLASGLVERIFWYSFKDEGSAAGNTWGLTAWGSGNTDLSPRRPSFAAYATSARMLAGATPLGQYLLGNPTTVQDFELPTRWIRSMNPYGDFTISSDQAHGGSSSAELQYRFDHPNQAVDFAAPQPVVLPGTPSQISVWVRGDGSGDYLSAWLRDRDGELFKVRLGAVTGAADGWRQYVAHINSFYFPWEQAGGNPANGKPDYPLSLTAFRLENTPDEPAGKGTIYIDDVQVIDGPDAWVSRFGRPDGQVVDVVWAAANTNVSLPTRSTGAQIVDRDGADRTITPQKGFLNIQAGTRPTYLVHFAADGPTPQGQGTSSALVKDKVSLTSACAAITRTGQRSDSLYFSATGHNLSGPFRTYWESHGGVKLFGYPITEEFTGPSTDGKTYLQQYFERARMEYHPENQPPNDVQLGLLGVWTTAGRSFAASPPPADPAHALYFSQTGQGINLFKDWWSKNGGLSVFGYPLSAEIQEKNAADGKTYTVQYFERNRLEYHPENKGTADEVLLGLLGVEYVNKLGCK